MPVSCTCENREMTAVLSGEIDHHGARAMMEELDRAVATALPTRLTLDLSGVTFMDSSGIAVLIRAKRRMDEAGRPYPRCLHPHPAPPGAGCRRSRPDHPARVKRSVTYMKAIDQATVTFTSRSANEGFARTAAACFAARLDPTLDEIADIKTAVSEAVTNAIVHAYPDSSGPGGHAAAAAARTTCWRCVVKDCGVGIAGRGAGPDAPVHHRRARSAPAWALPSWRALWTSLKVRSAAGQGHHRHHAQAHRPPGGRRTARGATLRSLLAAARAGRQRGLRAAAGGEQRPDLVAWPGGIMAGVWSREDLYQLGCLGFLKAVRGFDQAYGTQFSTYAVPKIAGEIRRFLRDDGAGEGQPGR